MPGMLVLHMLASCLRRHWIAVVMAFCITALVQAPLIAFPYAAGERYQGINIAHFGNDEHYYLSRAAEVAEGHSLGQPFLAQGKDGPDPTFSYAERAVLSPGMLFRSVNHENVVAYMNVANAIGVFVVFLLLYSLAFLISGSRLFALGAALFCIGGYSIVYNKTLFYNDFNVYGRSMFPYASSIPFLGSLILLWQGYVKGDVRFAVASGALAGLLCYIYFFGWTFAFACIGTLIALSLMTRAYDALRIGLAAFATAVVVGAPAIWMLFSFFASQAGERMSYFLLSSHGRVPIMSLLGLATGALFIPYLYRNRGDKNALFVAMIILAGWIALDQQLLTGRYVQYGHYYWYFVVPLSILVGSYMLWKLLPERYRWVLPAALILLALVNTAGGQYRSFSSTFEQKLREQDFAPVLAALRQKPSGTVFMGASGDTYPFLIPIYTDDDLYWLSAAALFPFPSGRLEEALLMNIYMEKDARSHPSDFLRDELNNGGEDTYTNLYTTLEGWRSGLDYYDYGKREQHATKDPVLAPLREELLSELSRVYRDRFSDRGAARRILEGNGVKYILWDKRQYPDWDLTPLQPLALIATSTDLALYELQ